MKAYIPVIISVLLLGCNEDGPDPARDNTVHMAGFITTSTGSPLAGYWKDGAFTNLVGDSAYSNVNSMFVAGQTVLIGGYNIVPPGEVVIWQNGTKSIVSDAFGTGPLVASNHGDLFAVWFSQSLAGWALNKEHTSHPLLDTAALSWPTDLAVSGDEMYISGVAHGNEFSPDTEEYYSDQYAQLWKNDRLVFRESRRSYAWCIFLNGNDIYIGGNMHQIPVGNRIACYWKNGKRVELTDGSQDAMVSSLVVADGSVYASGTIGGHACYWKDGAITSLPHGSIRSGGNAISVRDGEVHVAGYDDEHPAYWKNNERQNFAHQDMRGEIRFISVGSEVF